MNTSEISKESLHSCLRDPVMGAINFLNEIIDRYPTAISFAPGAPSPSFLESVDIIAPFNAYIEYLSRIENLTHAQVLRRTFQYGPSRGIINQLLSEALRNDLKIDVAANNIVVTVGFQEAVLLCLRALFRDSTDIFAVVQPCFVGAIGAARMLGIETVAINEGEHGVDVEELRAACSLARRQGKRIRGLYVSPDYANPSGMLMTRTRREALLSVADEEDIFLFEDTAYGFTSPSDRQIPSLKALDKNRRVIHFGTFSKIGFPGLRVGFVIADQRITGGALLADELAVIKSMTTVNTSPICQAIVGGLILNNGVSLLQLGLEKGEFYRERMASLLAALDRNVSKINSHGNEIIWNRPSGGFFVRLKVPVAVDEQLLDISARDYGVLWTPMAPFYLDGSRHNELRLSCSYLTDAQIEAGTARLERFLSDCRMLGIKK